MLPDEVVAEGCHAMTICNACRYCEAYCPVFHAMEDRLTFSEGDLTYLANLCHNCGECLYACQYAPPHEFGVNVPRTLARIRVASYEKYCWPAPFGAAFRRRPLATTAAVALAAVAVLFASARMFAPAAVAARDGDFYAVLPHRAMVALFGAVAGFVAAALSTAIVKFWRDADEPAAPPARPSHVLRAVVEGLTLKHLHAEGDDCTGAEELRRPWRRWSHHLTVAGAALCVASTSVAATYHLALGWRAPYPYLSLPVILGFAGGLALIVGLAGLLAAKRTRDDALADPRDAPLDVAFIALLLLTTATGLLLAVIRGTASMPAVLLVHLGLVLALFVMLPYGKFVHGLYRTAALVKYARKNA